MLEKRCAVVKVTDDTWKKLLFIEKIIKSRNAKYVKSLKRNKKNHLISEGCKKRKSVQKKI